MGSLKKVFGENDPAAINELGKFLKTCEEKRELILLLQDMLRTVQTNLEVDDNAKPPYFK